MILSVHLDSVFKDPFAVTRDGNLRGSCDNLAGILAAAQLIDEDGIWIEWTNDEEMHMDGARYVARNNNPKDTLMLVVDVTKKTRSKVSFTVENISGIKLSHIRKALSPFKGKYKILEHGAESEAWLYKEFGFCVLEVCVPVAGGLHSLDNIAGVKDIVTASKAIQALVTYFQGLDRDVISDTYRVGEQS